MVACRKYAKHLISSKLTLINVGTIILQNNCLIIGKRAFVLSKLLNTDPSQCVIGFGCFVVFCSKDSYASCVLFILYCTNVKLNLTLTRRRIIKGLELQLG